MQIKLSQPVRFILAGGAAAAINWLARIALSGWMPLAPSVVLAYAIGMLAGFVLYRAFVFGSAAGSAGHQAVRFIAVNAIGAAVVVTTTFVAMRLLEAAFSGGSQPILEALAHALAIVVGAFANYAGHKQFTFAQRADAHSR